MQLLEKLIKYNLCIRIVTNYTYVLSNLIDVINIDDKEKKIQKLL